MDHIVIQGALFDVEAVLEARAATRQHADPEARRVYRDLLLGDELLHLFSRPTGEGQSKPSCRGLLFDAHALLLPYQRRPVDLILQGRIVTGGRGRCQRRPPAARPSASYAGSTRKPPPQSSIPPIPGWCFRLGIPPRRTRP